MYCFVNFSFPSVKEFDLLQNSNGADALTNQIILFLSVNTASQKKNLKCLMLLL